MDKFIDKKVMHSKSTTIVTIKKLIIVSVKEEAITVIYLASLHLLFHSSLA